MSVVNSALSNLPFFQSQSASQVLSKPAAENPRPPAMEVSAQSAVSTLASIEHEMFVSEGERFNRDKRGFSKILKKKKVDVPENGKATDASGLLKAGTSNSAGAASKLDAEIAQEQANFKPKDDYASKLGEEKVVEPAPKTFLSTLEIPPSKVNGKIVEDFSSTRLAKADTELAEAVADTKVDLEPVKKKLSDTKKALLTAGVVATVTAVGALVTKGIEKAFTDSPADVVKKGFSETRIVDQLQRDVFGATDMLGRITGAEPVQGSLVWASKTNEERMTCLESITIALEKDFEVLAKNYGIPTSFSTSRSEDPDIAVRAKVIESRLAVITAIGHEVALKIKPTA